MRCFELGRRRRGFCARISSRRGAGIAIPFTSAFSTPSGRQLRNASEDSFLRKVKQTLFRHISQKGGFKRLFLLRRLNPLVTVLRCTDPLEVLGDRSRR